MIRSVFIIICIDLSLGHFYKPLGSETVSNDLVQYLEAAEISFSVSRILCNINCIFFTGAPPAVGRPQKAELAEGKFGAPVYVFTLVPGCRYLGF